LKTTAVGTSQDKGVDFSREFVDGWHGGRVTWRTRSLSVEFGEQSAT